MFARLEQVVEGLTTVVTDLEPAALSGHDAAALVDIFSRVERLAAAATTLLAGRVAECGTWKTDGARSPAAWLAHRRGTTVRDARDVTDTAARLRDCPATEDALRAGDLSTAQAAAVTAGAAEDPTAEGRLLADAATEPVDGLRRKSRAARRAAALEDDRDRAARHHARRRLRSWVDDDGMGCTMVRLPPDLHAELQAALAPFRDAAFRAARRAARREPYEAYAADGLVAMARAAATGSTPTKRRRRSADTTVIVRIDHAALFRGFTRGDEVCEIAGVGPVPVATVRRMIEAGDPFLATVITKGVDVLNVTHLGRRATAHQQTALWWRDPECCAEGCANTVRLQTDHRTDWARTRHTRLDDLDRLCPHCHDLKTRFGWRLDPGTGKRAFRPPDDPDPPPRAGRPAPTRAGPRHRSPPPNPRAPRAPRPSQPDLFARAG